MKITVDILKSFKKGEVKAFDVIFWQYNKHVYNFIYESTIKRGFHLNV